MIIQNSQLSMSSSFQRTSARSTEVSVRSWRDQAPGATARPRPEPPPAREREAGLDCGVDAPGHCDRGERGEGVRHGHLGRLIALVERLTGERVEVMDAAELTGGRDGHGPQVGEDVRPRTEDGRPRAGWGVRIEASETVVESESAEVDIAGKVTTADGRTIEVEVDLELYRQSARTTRISYAAGDSEPAPKDPLALSFGATPSLRSETADVDLDGDGTAEKVPFVGDGLAYLALDRNGNGRVDDGSELFGPRTDDGFAELAALDSDGNGWIDEADPAFAQLRLWGAPDAGLETLAERGVGAIATGSVASPYRLITDGETLGAVRSTGLWLAENGSAGTVHQIDVMT